MEFKSTLKRETERITEKVEQARANGMKEDPLIKKVFKLVIDAKCYIRMYARAVYIAKTIQPSIADDDCKKAADMQMALCSNVLLQLVKEELINIKEVK